MGCSEEKRGEEFFLELLQRLGIKSPENGSDEDIPALAVSVNPVRLKNNPVALDRTALENLYQNILAEEKGTEDGC